MGLWKTLSKNTKLRWKMTIPLIIVLTIGIFITVVISSYTLYYVNLYQAKKKGFQEYAKAVEEALVKDMESPDYQKLKTNYLKALKNVSIFAANKTTSKFEEKAVLQAKEVVYVRDHKLIGIVPLKAETRCLSCHKVKQGDILGGIKIVLDYSDIFTVIKKVVLIYIVLGIMGIIGASMCVYFVYLISHRPLENMVATLEKMAQGDLTINIKYDDYKDVVGRISRSIKKLLSFLKDLNEKSLVYSYKLIVSVTQNYKLINKVLDHAENQHEQAVQVATAVEEMTNTIADIAKNTTNVSELAVKNIKDALEGKKLSEDAEATIYRANQETQSLKKVIESLNKKTEEIGYIINLIKDIADQTNFLALNATIEAARAGSAGKGFTIVAEEIRKLADKTLKATDEIREKIRGIQTETAKVVKNMESTAYEVEQSIVALNKVREALDKIVQSSQEVKDAVSQIAAATQEQSIASEEISRNVDNMAELSQEVKKLIKEVEEAIYESVAISSDLRHTAASVKTEKLKEYMFNLFKSDHDRMILRVYAHLRDLEKLDPKVLEDFRKCEVGKWFYEGEGQKLASHPIFRKFEEIHKKFHKFAKEVILTYDKGEKDKAKSMLAELEEISKKFVSILEDLEKFYRENS
ncbi:MAG: chemotaxis protein [Thermodesulfobacteria bacterium]|nr:chemotaxis protein [Thermodesulfobacteriota bacterium]